MITKPLFRFTLKVIRDGLEDIIEYIAHGKTDKAVNRAEKLKNNLDIIIRSLTEDIEASNE